MALYIPHSIFHLVRLLYVRPENFGPYYVHLSIPSSFSHSVFPSRSFIRNFPLPHTFHIPHLTHSFQMARSTPRSNKVFRNTLRLCFSGLFVCETLLQIEIFHEIPLLLLNCQYKKKEKKN